MPDAPGPAVRHTNPCILHYAIGAFTEFARKYTLLGSFDDRWFSTVDIRQKLPFHTAARDTLAQG